MSNPRLTNAEYRSEVTRERMEAKKADNERQAAKKRGKKGK